MPGPGQGKRSQKKKWRDNALSLNESTTAVNAVITAPSTSAPTTTTATPTMSSLSDISAAEPPATQATTADTAAPDANDTSTAMSSTNDTDSPPFTYSHNEVQQLLEDARLDGWQKGFNEGHKTGRKTGIEQGKEEGYNEGHSEGFEYGYDARRRLGEQREAEARKKGQIESYDLGVENGKEEERRKWLTEGHGAGLCLTMAAHARALLRGAVLLEEAETQTDPETTTWNDASTQAAPRTDETASQTMQTASN